MNSIIRQIETSQEIVQENTTMAEQVYSDDHEESRSLLLNAIQNVEDTISIITDHVKGNIVGTSLKATIKEYLYVVGEMGDTWDTLFKIKK